jgi:hypothetical protein
VTQLQATRHPGRDGSEAAMHSLAHRLKGLEAIDRPRCMNADYLAVAGGDAVRQLMTSTSGRLVRPISATQLIELRRARQQRGERRAADLSPLSFCLPPSNPGSAPARSRPRNRLPTETPSDPPPSPRSRSPPEPHARVGLNPLAHLVGAYWGTT